MAAAVVLAACQVGQVVPVPPGARAPAVAAPGPAPARGQPPARTDDPAPQPIMMGDDAKAIKFLRLVPAFARGDRIGEVRAGASCETPSPLIWKGDQTLISDKDAARAFYTELLKANYLVVNPDELFESAVAEPDFLIAGRITQMAINYCGATKEEGKGDNSVTIEWQLFDLLSRRTVLKATTTGKMRIDTNVTYGDFRLIYGAIANATRALLADADFHAIVAGKVDVAPQIAAASFRLYPRPPFVGEIGRHMTEIQSATVTVLAPGSHGSGFFVSSDGYLLTNAHVVGDAKFVRVRLATGREIAAEVIVVNRGRDVALVKVAETGLMALPIAMVDAPVGSEIYAVGSPREEKLASTVTRGIVSAYRVRDRHRMIQGDVTVQKGNSGGPLIDSSGNVVGITVSGVMNNTFSVGLNFFIPIIDGLKAVGIDLGDARVASPMRVLEQQVAVALQPGRPKPLPTPEPQRDAATPPPAATPAVTDVPQQVAALPPAAAPAKRDGDYRTTFTAITINGRSYVDLAISVEGETIRGVGRTRGGLQCRAAGEIAPDGTAWINVACSNAGSAYLSWQLAGRFVVEKDGAAYIGRLAYANLTGGPGEAVFRPQQG